MSTSVDSLTFARFLGKHPSEQLHSLKLWGSLEHGMSLTRRWTSLCWSWWRATGCHQFNGGARQYLGTNLEMDPRWPCDFKVSDHAKWGFFMGRDHGSETNTWQHHEFTVVVIFTDGRVLLLFEVVIEMDTSIYILHGTCKVWFPINPFCWSNRCTLWVFPNIAMETPLVWWVKHQERLGFSMVPRISLVTGWLLVFV